MNKLQDIFNRVAKHLLKQNAKSEAIIGYSWMCAYRGENGLKCAAGCLVSDEEYDTWQEYRSWKDTKWANNYTHEENELIVSLQRVHDWQPVENWKHELVSVAESYDLELIPELK